VRTIGEVEANMLHYRTCAKEMTGTVH
jgi:hypothetical protein